MAIYQRINRNNLLVDSNVTNTGSISETISNPVQKENAAYLLSRVGNAGVINTPKPGYVIHFSGDNSTAYIQTLIPSTEIDDYDIIIKGEGNIDLLKVDTSATNIKIVQKQVLTTTDNLYFDLSYIAFKNRLTKVIIHLLECEEGNGSILYDACTGAQATIESVTSLSSLRITSSSKEWIKNEDKNLNNIIEFNNGVGLNTPFTSQSLNLPISICVTYDVDSWEGIGTGGSAGVCFYNCYGVGWTTPIKFYGFTLKYNEDKWLELFVGQPDTVDIERRISVKTTNSGKGLPTGKHSIIVTIGAKENNIDYTSSKIKFYIDGVSIPFTAGKYNVLYNNISPKAGSDLIVNGKYNYNSSAVAKTPSLANIKLSKMKIFNFDMSASDAAYTIQDYVDGKDTPQGLDGTDFTLTQTDKDCSGDITTTLNVTNTDGVFTFNYPPLASGYRTYTVQLPADGTTLTNVSATTTVGTQTVTMTGDIDNATTPTTFSFKGFQILCANTSWSSYKVGKWSGTFRGNFCKTTTEDLPEGVSYGTLLGGLNAWPGTGTESSYFLGFRPNYTTKVKWAKTKVSFWFKRVTPYTYYSASFGIYNKKLWSISSADYPLNEWVRKEIVVDVGHEGFYAFCFAANSTFSGSGTTASIKDWSFCIADVNIEPLRDVIDLDNISKSNNLWLDKASKNYNLSLTGTYNTPNKNYGTWCNGVGYGIDSNSNNAPRKIINNTLISDNSENIILDSEGKILTF